MAELRPNLLQRVAGFFSSGPVPPGAAALAPDRNALSAADRAELLAGVPMFAERFGPVTAAAPAKEPAHPTANLMQIVRPEVRDRFQGLLLRGMTPERVQQILDGAFTGNLQSQFELFDLMEDTWPRLKKNLNEVKRAVVMADWHAEASSRPEQAATPLAQKKADFLNEVIDNAFHARPEEDENDFDQLIYDLCDAFGKGTSVQEIYWEERDTFGDFGYAVVPRATKWIPSRFFGYAGTTTALQLFPRGMSGADATPFPPDKFIVAFFKTKTGHAIGGGLLRSLASWWISASFAQDWALNLAQIFGLPIRTAEYDPQLGKGLRDDIADMLDNMGAAAWGLFPIGTKLTLHEAMKAAGESPQAFIMSAADMAADIAILGQTLTTSVGRAGGNRALGQVHNEVREEILKYVARWAQKRLNQMLVAPLMRLNFGDNEDDPKLVCEIEEIKDQKAMADRDAVLLDRGVPVGEKWFYERHGIPIPGKGEKILKLTPLAGSGDKAGSVGSDATTARAAIQAKSSSATDKLVENVLEDLTGVEARWLGGVKPFFAQLVEMAQNEHVTDAELLRTLEGAVAVMPELFDKLDTGALQTALENAMAPALVNGAAKGVMERRLAAA